MLRHRLFFGALLILGFLGLIYLDARLSAGDSLAVPGFLRRRGLHYCDGAIITALVAVLVIFGTLELHRLLVAAGHAPLRCWPVLVNLGLLVISFVAGNGSLYDAAAGLSADAQLTVVWLFVALLGAAFFVACRRRTAGAVGAIAATLFAVFYLGLLSQFLIRLRLSEPELGAWLLLYFVAVVKFCDIGAYFTGLAIGRHKLIPWLSPGKTVEGLFGGMASSAAAAVLIPLLVRCWTGADSALHELFPQPKPALVFGVVVALAGQAGDLLESLIKRDAQAKDSAAAIPGFGGVLDVLDSPLLAAPIAFLMLQ